MPARPNVLVGVGGPVRAGEQVVAQVTLESSSETRVDTVDVFLQAAETIAPSSACRPTGDAHPGAQLA